VSMEELEVSCGMQGVDCSACAGGPLTMVDGGALVGNVEPIGIGDGGWRGIERGLVFQRGIAGGDDVRGDVS